MPSLRARRRVRTEDTIRKVAVELVYAHGLDRVTAEMISAEAKISRRTFFNYFPYKEAALFPAAPEFPPEAVQAFIKGKGGLIDDLGVLLSSLAGGMAEDRDFMRKLFAIADTHPKLLMIKIGNFQTFEENLRLLFAERMNVDAEHEQAVLTAALVATTLRVSITRWVARDSGNLEDCILPALASLSVLFSDA